jgi:PKD repeat protein
MGVYTAYIEDINGCKDTQTVTVALQTWSNLTIEYDTSFCVGATWKVNVTIAGGVSGYSFYWTGPNSYVNGNDSISISNIQSANSGKYFLKIIDKNGCTRNDSIRLYVRSNPVTNFTVNQYQCFKNNNFKFTNTSTNASAYKWTLGDGSAVQTTTIPSNKSYSAPGTYSVKLSAINNFGCKDSITKPMYVYSMPVANFTVNKDSLCINSTTGFLFTSTSTIATGGGTLEYNWNFGDFTTSTLQNPIKKYTKDTIRFVRLVVKTSPYGCYDTIIKKVVIKPKPMASINLV